MLAALDRHFEGAGGETLALIAVLATLAWVMTPHWPASHLWLAEVHALTAQAMACVCGDLSV